MHRKDDWFVDLLEREIRRTLAAQNVKVHPLHAAHPLVVALRG